MSAAELLTLLAVGLLAGSLGGLMGIGGSIVMIPVLTLVLHHDQHISQAAAMIVNIFVSVPAVWRHRRAGSVPWDVVRRVLPVALVCILIGVEASNRVDGARLMQMFGVFLIYVIYANLMKLIHGPQPGDDTNGAVSWPRASTVGGITGFAAGLLGIGGGIIAVPLLQRICRLDLRKCIGVSAATMCATATIGAIHKNIALNKIVTEGNGGLTPLQESLLIALCLAPTALVGGLLGASLTHILPVRWIRVVLLVLLTVAAVKFLGIM